MMASNPLPGKCYLASMLRDCSTNTAVPELEVSAVTSNSRSVMPNSVFIAQQGEHNHGIDFAIDAVKAGATVVLYDAADEYCQQRILLLGRQVTAYWIGIEQLDRLSGEIVSRFYGEPSKSMTVIGVTGTDGKTSVTHLLTQALGRLGKIAASIGTIGYGIGEARKPTTHTTPYPDVLQSYLFGFSRQNCEYVVMEVSSHALDQYRVAGCHFDIGVLTNLGRDHLDYHGDRSQYAAAKARLFRDYRLAARVVNIDDEFGRSLSNESEASGLFRFTASSDSDDAEAEVRLLHSDMTGQGLHMTVATPVGDVNAVTGLIGRFNIENMLACIGVLNALGFEQALVQQAVTGLQPIPGRMEQFSRDDNSARAVIDFAHTEQALRACLNTCREHTRGQLWCVFGCGGDRDKGKRKGMAKAAEELADRVVVTDDNPRTESAVQIVSDILAGMVDPAKAHVEHDRRAAIAYALSQAGAGDLVVIAGKGHEQDQIIGHQRLPFSDREVVQKLLQVAK